MKSGNTPWVLGAIGAALLVSAVLAFSTWRTMLASLDTESAPSTVSTPAHPTAQFRLLSSRITRDGSRSTVAGEVENIGNAELDHISAVITWRDASGAFVAKEESILDVSPIPPGGRSTWDVITRMQPDMKSYSISFSRGQKVIPHIESGK